MLRKILLCLLPLVSFSACKGGCSDELRGSSATGTLGTSPSRQLEVAIGVSQNRQHGDQDNISWQLVTDQYVGHIKTAVLYDARDPSRALVNIPLTSPTNTIISQGTSTTILAPGVTMSDVYELLRSTQAHVRATTDLANPTQIDVSLTPAVSNGWNRIGCYS
ncbi:MAG TPA: hypothetical protein VM166_08505 [Gemmatimonadaceae bacterium]|nr:hypothetical protein [Gemmatimonadaceae bacterium]